MKSTESRAFKSSISTNPSRKMAHTENFSDKVAEVCISKYNGLKKNGKPKNPCEWTLLACFIQEDQSSGTLKVVALGTGSKCIGSQQLPVNGDILHDSHAEVIARRAFVLYLIHQVREMTKGCTSIFQQTSDKLDLKPGIIFHFYASHTPCGDASIFPKGVHIEGVGKPLETKASLGSCAAHPTPSESKDCEGVISVSGTDSELPAKRRRVGGAQNSNMNDKVENNMFSAQDSTDISGNNNQSCENETIMNNIKDEGLEGGQDSSNPTGKGDQSVKVFQEYKDKNESFNDGTVINDLKGSAGDAKKRLPDTFRTGAKCVAGEASDPKLPGIDYHITGVLRTKPGRGDPTLSMSCSDKMFKWTVLGVQGAILMILLNEPVYVDTIVIGRCPYSHQAMTRAMFDRFKESLKGLKLPAGFSVHTPRLLQSHVDFPHSQGMASINASESPKLMPTATSVIWSDTDVHQDSHEVATNGRRLGCTKKNLGTPKSWLSVCRKAMASQMLPLLKDKIKLTGGPSLVSYSDLKCFSETYSQTWSILKQKCLKNWTVKPKHLKDFTVI